VRKRESADRAQRKKQCKVNSEDMRRHNFFEAIKKGRIYDCFCCDRRLFRSGVEPQSTDFREILEKRYPGLFDSAIGEIDTKIIDGQYHMCRTCNSYIKKGKVPPMSKKNNLELFDISNHQEFQLTELENCMIALNILFQKIYKLPKSRWPAMKDKTINIPIFEDDVLTTVKSIPRPPSEARIIAVNLKRKKSFKNSHKSQYVLVSKLFS